MTAPANAPHKGLWRDPNFLTFWGGQALSQVGAQFAELAIPVLAVLLLHAGDAEVGYLNAAGTAAFLLVGLPAGAWIDRLRKRRVMIVADGVRAAALAAVPLLHLTGQLQFWHLYVVALVIGVATVFFDVSYQSLVPSLVDGERIAEANGKLESTQQVAGLAGPALAGGVIGLVSAPMAILATAVTYLCSLVALVLVRDREVLPPRAEHAPLRTEIAEGLHWVFGNPLLRRIVGTTAIGNGFSTIVFTLEPIFLLRVIGFTPEQMGLILTLAAFGGLAGALSTPWLTARIGEARLVPVSAILLSVALVPLPLAVLLPRPGAFALLAVQGAAMSFAVVAYNITQVTFRQRITPKRLLGRMNASIRFCVWGIMPLSALAAGWLGSGLGTVPAIWVGVAGAALSALPVALGPFWRLRDLPVAAE
ncbi:MAG: MFS transporter [Arachnia sp.]